MLKQEPAASLTISRETAMCQQQQHNNGTSHHSKIPFEKQKGKPPSLFSSKGMPIEHATARKVFIQAGVALLGAMILLRFATALWLGGLPLFCGYIAWDDPVAVGLWLGVQFLYEMVDTNFDVETSCWFCCEVLNRVLPGLLVMLNCCHLEILRDFDAICIGFLEPWSQGFFCVAAALFSSAEDGADGLEAGALCKMLCHATGV
ncbi:hypothetical protein Nepgr_017433 [Nepenthes gracilis]|uniref:Uncharacterized protein n=1 Tax=Nepenthes gracilis TaxID=150966 RepID=A0AAD3SR37_NEPGR|nr:hypothetical protein Nepgr_017433 [Nepenthes gracilis]